MSMVKLRKPIPQEDRQMLLDLAEKGFLPLKAVQDKIDKSVEAENVETLKATLA